MRRAKWSQAAAQGVEHPGHLPDRVAARKVPRAEYRSRARARRSAGVHRRRCAALAEMAGGLHAGLQRDRCRLRGRSNSAALGSGASALADAGAARRAGGSRRRHRNDLILDRRPRSGHADRRQHGGSTTRARSRRRLESGSRQTEEHACVPARITSSRSSSPQPDSPASTNLKRACCTASPLSDSDSDTSSAGATATDGSRPASNRSTRPPTNYLLARAALSLATSRARISGRRRPESSPRTHAPRRSGAMRVAWFGGYLAGRWTRASLHGRQHAQSR